VVVATFIGAIAVLGGVLLAESLAKRREQKNRFDDAQMEMWALGDGLFEAPFSHQGVQFLTCLGRMLREAHDPLPNAKPIATEVVAMMRRYLEVKAAWAAGDQSRDGRYVIGDRLAPLTDWHRPEFEPPTM